MTSDRKPSVTLEDSICDHVFGSSEPCESLLNRGAFPEGWVDTYLEVLGSLSDRYRTEAMLPRRVVWAVHFASWYLPLRYDAWCLARGSTNAKTVGELARIRTPSEFFIYGVESDVKRWQNPASPA